MDINLPRIGDEIYVNRIKYRIHHLDGYKVVNGKYFAENIVLMGAQFGTTFHDLPLEQMFTTSEFDSFFKSLVSSEQYERGIRIIEKNCHFLGLDLLKKISMYTEEKINSMEWNKAEVARRWAIEIWKTGDEENTEFIAHGEWDLGCFYEKRAEYYEEKQASELGRQYRMKSIKAYEESKRSFQQIKRDHDVNQIQYAISINYWHLKENKRALDILNQIEPYFVKHGSKEEYYKILLKKSEIYDYLRMYEKARESHVILYELATKAGQEKKALEHLHQQICLLINQGKLILAHTLLGDYERLIEGKESLMVDTKWLWMTIAKKQGDFTKMEQVISELILFFKNKKDKLQLAKVYKEQASFLEGIGRYQEALDFYRKAQELFELLEAFKPLGRLEMEIGILYKNLNRFADALDHHRRAWDIFASNDMGEEMELCRKNLETTITKAAYQHSKRDEKLWDYTKLINEGKIDELITCIEEGSDIWKKY